MIIDRIHLHPFAGVVNSEQFFHEGLNVICGPNEAGKSTFVKALTMALFTPVELTPARERETLKDLLPVSGGDTIRVDLDFSVDHQEYQLLKCWGGKKSVKLILPDGNDLSNDEAVAEKMAALLDLNEATYRNVLITYQSALGRTIHQLQDEKEVRNTLSERLRNTVMQQDNIPVDDFHQKLTEKLDAYYGNWDIRINGPRNNRGIENKYQKGNGYIIETYYKMKELELELKKALEYERQLDNLVLKLSKAEEKLIQSQSFIDHNKDVVKDTRDRDKLESELGRISVLYDQLTADFTRWPALEQKISHAKSMWQEESDRLEKIKEELLIAQKTEASVSLKQQFLDVVKLRERLENLQARMKETQPVSESDINKAENLEKKLLELKVQVEAQKLKFQITSANDLKVLIQAGLDSQENVLIKADETFEKEVEGKFNLNIPNLSISVESANADITALMDQIKTIKEELLKFLSQWKVGDISGLKAHLKNYRELDFELKQAKNGFDEGLKGKSFDELKEEYIQIRELPPVRSVSAINQEYIKASAKLKVLENELKESEVALKALIEKHGSQKDLMDRLVKGEQKREDTKNKLNLLAPLPEGYANAEEFIDKYDEYNELNRRLVKTVNELKDEKRLLEKNEPEYLVDELKDAIQSAAEQFERKKAEGEAYQLIRTRLEDILKNIDEETYRPLQDAVNKYLSDITGQRYQQIMLDEVVPLGLVNCSKTLRMPHLSKGTLDAAALALRLGMAEFYLEGRDGFVIMDDPFVDMDETRQRAAADTIIEYAMERQVIIYTCHQKHAEILLDEYVMMK